MVYKFFDSKVAPLDKKSMSGKGNAKHSSLELTENNKILAEDCISLLLKNLIKEKYIRNLEIIYGV